MQENVQHISEETLLALYYKEGNNVYVGELLSRYTMRLFGVSMKYLKDEDEAKDMVQQVFVKALQEIGKYKIDNFGGWLYRIAQNACISQIRTKKNFVEDTALKYVHSETEVADAEFWKEEQNIHYLHQAIALLKEDQRHCIELFYLQKKSYQQIVAESPYTIKEVKSNIQNGKRNLKILIEQIKKDAKYV
ncbi:sigma-70 family RNA polymerase sigma factor [Taibaiella sp. KBW10]|uniref:RNA polymerase sigma factor n=1 Tax=Taibaiella sp. KBW10 TaxID=2153357 RepID=UPI000F5B7355|nr:sigma-70 family RNA polymerase sigma factor [Taibaiella sp. KBW10]RQO31466.1 sigma-70 family RNA polymerase sigma factor [Taibaiella sp. KBW10]